MKKYYSILPLALLLILHQIVVAQNDPVLPFQGELGKSLNETQQSWIKHLELIGTEFSSSNYPQGWAQAANTPFRYWKQDANSEGGTHNPLIIHWPNGIKEKGGIRQQYSHAIDITPTTIELVGATVPAVINGYAQQPFERISTPCHLLLPES